MRRVWIIGGWVLAGLVGLTVLLCVTVLVAGNTDAGRTWLSQLTSRLTGGQVQVEGLGGAFPQDLQIRRLQLKDRQGVWLSAERITLHWSPFALLRHRLRVDTLHVGYLDVERTPVSEPTREPRRQSPLPRIHVRQLAVDTLELGPALAGVRTSLQVSGDVHLMSMQDARAHLSARRTSGEGRYEVDLRFDPRRMDAKLRLEEPAGGPLASLVRVPTLGAVQVVGSLAGPREAERLDLTVQAGQLHGETHGFIDVTHKSSHLDYDIQSGAMRPRPDIAWEKIDLKGSFHGPWTAPRAQGHTLIDQLQLPGSARIAHLAATLSGDAGVLSTHAQAHGVVIPGPHPGLLEDAPLVVDASVHLDKPGRPLELTARHRLASVQARGVTEGNLAMKVDATLADLAPLAAFGGLALGGTGQLSADIARRGSATDLNLSATADVTGGGQPDFGQILGRGTQLQLAASLTDRTLTVQRLKLTGAVGTVTANGEGARTPPGAAGGPLASLDARSTLDIGNLTALLPELAGRLNANVKVSGPLRSLDVTVDGQSLLSLRGSTPSTIEAHVKAHGLPSLPGGTIEARGDLEGSPLRVHAAVERGPGRILHVTVHDTDWKSAHAEGDIRAAADLALGQGRLTVRIERLEDLAHLLGMPLSGRIVAQAGLNTAGGDTRAQLQLTAQDVAVAGIRGSGELSASGPLDDLSTRLALQLPDVQGGPARLDATAQVRLPRRELTLLTAQGSYRAEPLVLAAPARIRLDEGVTVSELRLGARKAVLAISGRLSPTLDARASLTQVDAALINAFVPDLLAQGQISAQAQLRGPPSAPQGNVQVQVTDVRLSQPAAHALPLLAAQGSAQLRGDGLALVDARLSAGGGSQLHLHGQAPLPAARQGAGGQVDLTLSGKLDLALTNPLLETHGQHAAGTVAVDAHVTGTLAQPAISGGLTLEHGDLRDYTQGVHLSNVQGQLTGSHGVLEIRQLSAKAASGDVNVTGTLAVLQPDLPVDLHLRAHRAQPLASDILTANVDADLTLKGTLQERLALAGTVHVNRADIGIPNSLPPDVAVLDVRRPGEAPPAPPEKPLEVLLDVRLDAPRQILVTGRGLDAELGGNLHIRGTKEQPTVSGGFDMIRGTLSLASTPLNFTAGKVSFSGAGLKGRLDPSLDFTAQSAVADTTATLRITGLADSPQFQLSSTPQDLPQDEILARLLFGQSASSLSASQAVSMASALATLTGMGSGVNPLVKVQKSLGLDRLSVSGGTPGASSTSTQQNTGATLEAGRYVASNVFVAARQSTTGVTQLVVDVDLTRRLKVRTRLGNGSTNAQGVTPENDPGSSIGISYQFEY